MKVGPKGQVVIPKTMRRALKIEPGSKVLLKLEDNKVILEKPFFDAVSVFQQVAARAMDTQKLRLNRRLALISQNYPVLLNRRSLDLRLGFGTRVCKLD